MTELNSTKGNRYDKSIHEMIKLNLVKENRYVNPFMPTVSFNICCPRDCVSRHNGGTAGAPLKPLRDDSALRSLSSLRG